MIIEFVYPSFTTKNNHETGSTFISQHKFTSSIIDGKGNGILVMNVKGCSESMNEYFRHLQEETDRCYKIASTARKKGLDPETVVEIPQAEDLAATVEKLLKYDNIAEKIRDLSKKYDREEVSLRIGMELIKDKNKDRNDILKEAVRAGLAILTEGRCCAPLEGVTDVKVCKNPDGTEYVSIYYAGPIRSAGGTAQAMSVLIADVVRRALKIGPYIASQPEIERYKEEIPLYKQCQHLQYTPSNEEIELIVSHCPICIDGEGTEEVEISGYRNLPRVETNRVRGGACLIIAEGLSLKAAKILKHVNKLNISGWEFLQQYISLKAKKKEEQSVKTIVPNFKYMQGAIAGRPVFSHPMKIGGFRLRYGRTRTTGLAAIAIHPAAMYVLDEFISIGTQLKVERPGKAGVVTSCTDIEPPIVLLDNNDLVEVENVAVAIQLKNQVKKIIDLGEMLVSLGEFLENNHQLVPGAYCKEWWVQELKKVIGEDAKKYVDIDAECAVELSDKYKIPLHPVANLFWHDISIKDIETLSKYIQQKGFFDGRRLQIPSNPEIKNILIDLGALHVEREGKMVFTKYSIPLIRCLGLTYNKKTFNIERTSNIEASKMPADTTPTMFVSALSGFIIRERAPTRIGAKMGRPEKAGPRKMSPPPHVLFPLGDTGGSQRLLSNSITQKNILVEIGKRYCPKCQASTFKFKCNCGEHTLPTNFSADTNINIAELYTNAIQSLDEMHALPDIKGVQGLISKYKTPEPLEKGLLRAKYGVSVFKDGTCRFDMINISLTHFKPSEIGLSVSKAIELGYTKDYEGKPLTDENQIVELKCQDIVPSKSCGTFLVAVSKFIDDLLERFYKIKPFYKAENPEDLIGQLVVGLSPHTSGGVLVRLIGYTTANAEYAHPFFHAAKRRNADGDEDCVMLLMDALLNFSHSFLPEKRGGLMDAPLVLSTRINPAEIDKEAYNLDVARSYPIEIFEAAANYTDIKIVEPLIDNIAKKIGTESQYENFGFTHNTDHIGLGPASSMYQRIDDMVDKLDAQLALQMKIRAVDANDATSRLIDNHFLPDMYGNLRKFSTQQVRCTKCNKKYRRVPLAGVCTNPVIGNGGICGNNLTLTVHEGSVKKYLEKTKEICETYNVHHYVKQQISIVENAINSTFQNDKIKKFTIDDFM